MGNVTVAVSRADDYGTLDRDWPAVGAAAAGLILSVGTLSVYSFGVFIHPLHAAFGWNRTQLSGAIAISQYGLAFSSPIWGVLADRFGPRAILLPSIVALSALFASLAWLTPHLWHLYLVFAAFPILAGGAAPLGYSAVLVRRFERHLGLALGLGVMGVGLGASILPPLAQRLVGSLGWRDAYATLGLITLLVSLPAVLIATRKARGPVIRSPGQRASPLLPMIRTRAFVLMCSIFLLLGIVTVGTLAHLVPMMIDHGFAAPAAARIAGLTGLAALVGRGGIGWVLDRVQASRVLSVLALFAATAFLLLGFGTWRGSNTLAAILLGTVLGAEVDFIAFLTRRHFAQEVFGRLYGLAFSCFMIGAGTGPLVMSTSFDHLGGYRPGLVLFALLSAVVATAGLALPRYGRPGAKAADRTDGAVPGAIRQPGL